MPQEKIFKEKYGCLGVENIYVKPADQNAIVRVDDSEVSGGKQGSDILLSLKRFFTEVFLPQGYPSSVSEDYWSYQYWDTIQAFCSSICGTLTTHAIMKGVGVGDTVATPLAAAITWILKDGTGMIGRIAFAWWKGSRLDAECKSWRLVADVLNDIAMFAEMVLPYVPNYATCILCASQSAKAIVGVAGGATRAAITQHQAIRGNTGDVSAKDGSQEMCVNLVASFVGIFLLTTVTNPFCVWSLFLTFTCLHILANYQAVLSLKLVTLNSERMLLIMKHWLESEEALPPSVINLGESIFPGYGLTTKEFCGFDIHLGCSLQQFLKHKKMSAEELQFLTRGEFQNTKFLLLIDPENLVIRVVFRENESPVDVIRAYFTSICIAIVFSKHKKLSLPHVPDFNLVVSEAQSAKKMELICNLTETAEQFETEVLSLEEQIVRVIRLQCRIDDEFFYFARLLKDHGWQTDRHHLVVDEWRASWAKPL